MMHPIDYLPALNSQYDLLIETFEGLSQCEPIRRRYLLNRLARMFRISSSECRQLFDLWQLDRTLEAVGGSSDA